MTSRKQLTPAQKAAATRARNASASVEEEEEVTTTESEEGEEGEEGEEEEHDPTFQEEGPDNRPTHDDEEGLTNEDFDPTNEETGPDNRPNEMEEAAADTLLAGHQYNRIAGTKRKPSDFDEDTVTMHFPQKVRLTTDDHQVVEYPAGINEVPASHADHWYIKAHGVREHVKPARKKG